MKKLLAFMLVCGSVLTCLTACGESGSDSKKSSDNSSSAAGYEDNDDADYSDSSKSKSNDSEVVEDENYITKSKITACDVSASSLSKACNAALTDFDASGIKVTGSGWIEFSDGQFENASAFGFENNSSNSKFDDLSSALSANVKNYFSDIDKCTGSVYIKDGACTAVVLKINNDSEYWGTYPSGHITEKGISEDDAKAAVAEFAQ